jgi:nucleoside-diphosphate-sugar epimerase
MGHDVTVAHRGETEADLPESIRHIHHPALGYLHHEFIAGAADELRRVEPEVVAHMIPGNEVDARAVMNTFRGVAHRAVGISSIDVYRAYGRLHLVEPGPPDPVPLTEDSPLRERLFAEQLIWPGSPPVEKILAEREILGDRDLPGTILRWGMVYGPGDQQHRLHNYLAPMDAGRPVMLMEERAHRWRWSRAYSENVAAAVVAAVTDERATGRVYNVAEKDALSESEWAGEIAKAAGWNGRVVSIPRDRAPAHLVLERGFDQDWIVDTSRIRAELGYSEEVTRDEALRVTVDWERRNPKPNTRTPEEVAERFRLEDEALRRLKP